MQTQKVKIYVIGLASEKLIKEITASKDCLQLKLMDLLRAKGIPVASSCWGEGVCGKCVVNGNLLSCQLSVRQFLQSANKNVPDSLQYSMLKFCKKFSLPAQSHLIFISYL